MNKTLFGLFSVALLATSIGVFALDEKPKKAGRSNAARAPGERLKTMAEKLDLTVEQKEKVKAIILQNAPKMKELRADTALSKEAKRAKIMEIRKAEMKEIRALLTPEQTEKLKELRPAGKGRKAAK